MSKCSSCKKDFIPLLKNNGLPFQTCDRCRSDDKKNHIKNKEKNTIFIIENLIKISLKKKLKNILKKIRMIRSPDGLVVGSCTTLEFWVRFPNERNQGKQEHPVFV